MASRSNIEVKTLLSWQTCIQLTQQCGNEQEYGTINVTNAGSAHGGRPVRIFLGLISLFITTHVVCGEKPCLGTEVLVARHAFNSTAVDVIRDLNRVNPNVVKVEPVGVMATIGKVQIPVLVVEMPASQSISKFRPGLIAKLFTSYRSWIKAKLNFLGTTGLTPTNSVQKFILDNKEAFEAEFARQNKNPSDVKTNRPPGPDYGPESNGHIFVNTLLATVGGVILAAQGMPQDAASQVLYALYAATVTGFSWFDHASRAKKRLVWQKESSIGPVEFLVSSLRRMGYTEFTQLRDDVDRDYHVNKAWMTLIEWNTYRAAERSFQHRVAQVSNSVRLGVENAINKGKGSDREAPIYIPKDLVDRTMSIFMLKTREEAINLILNATPSNGITYSTMKVDELSESVTKVGEIVENVLNNPSMTLGPGLQDRFRNFVTLLELSVSTVRLNDYPHELALILATQSNFGSNFAGLALSRIKQAAIPGGISLIRRKSDGSLYGFMVKSSDGEERLYWLNQIVSPEVAQDIHTSFSSTLTTGGRVSGNQTTLTSIAFQRLADHIANDNSGSLADVEKLALTVLK